MSSLCDSQKVILQNNIANNGPIAILGAGTGLGMARGIQTSEGIMSIPSEGGHREFAPRNEEEWIMTCWLKKDLGTQRLSIERVASGTGLGNIAYWLLNKVENRNHLLYESAINWRNYNNKDLPALASEYAAQGDPLMKHAVNIWLSAYGAAAGDLALHELCTGGLWICGGTTQKHIDGLNSKTFMNALCMKGRFEKFLISIPITAITDPLAGLFSAACRARMLEKRDGRLN